MACFEKAFQSFGERQASISGIFQIVFYQNLVRHPCYKKRQGDKIPPKKTSVKTAEYAQSNIFLVHDLKTPEKEAQKSLVLSCLRGL